MYPIEHHNSPRPPGSDGNPQPYRRIEKTPPDLCLHTTEGTDLDTAIATLKAKFSPPQWAVGENRIAQLRPLWAQGASVDTQNAYLMQIEIVAKSQVTLWLPQAESLNPLVALVAFLHQEHIITTGTGRPKTLEDLPLVLDKLPAAVDTYYRRALAPLPTFDGVRGHVDLKDDEHWDPGSFDYPTFFQLVEGVIGGDDMTPEEKATFAKLEKFYNALTKSLGQTGNPTEPATADGAGIRVARAVKHDESGEPGAVPPHSHKGQVTVT